MKTMILKPENLGFHKVGDRDSFSAQQHRLRKAGHEDNRRIRPISGYAYEHSGKDWATSSSEDWNTVLISESEIRKAKFLGTRDIDGSKMAVWKAGRVHIAQLAHMVGA